MNKMKDKKEHISILFFLIGIALLICAINVLPNDYWWHLKSGEYMVKNKTIPYTDVFSWYGIENKLYWYSHEWLTAVLLFILSPIKNSWYWYVLFSIALLFILLYLLNRKYYEHNLVLTMSWFGFGGILFIKALSPRPHMISFILLAITIYLINDVRTNEDSKKIWFLPIISILWANFHGGSSNLPYILILIVLVTGLSDFKIGKITGFKLTKKQQRKYISVFFLCMGAVVINPHGANMITYPYVNMGDNLMLNTIIEWRSPDLKRINDLVYYVTIVSPLLILFINEDKEVDFTDLSFIGAFVYLSCKSIRFTFLLFIISTFIICKYINNLKIENIAFIDKLKSFTEFKDISHKCLITFMRIISVISIIVFIYGYFVLDVTNDFSKPVVNDKIIERIKQENPKRLYNEYDFGGYLIYKDIPVFVDGRADMYSMHNLEDSTNLSGLNNDVDKIINKYNFDMYLIYKDSPIYNYLKVNSNYKLLNEDDCIALVKKIN